jgi:ATP-dependent Lhr-like helicase
VFITKGLPWKVVSIDENVVSVEPSMEVEAAIPDWVGEDIPVSYETARGFLDAISGGIGELKRFCSSKTWDKVSAFLEEQKGHHIPSRNEVVVESFSNYKVIYTWLGTAANDALSKMLAKEIGRVTGSTVAIRSTPYAVIVDAGSGRFDVKKILERIATLKIKPALESVLEESEIFRYKFIAVAKLFGLIDREALVSRSMARRLMKVLDGSPITQEVRRELMENHFDIGNLVSFLEDVGEERVAVREVVLDAASPLTKALVGYSSSARELMLPLTPNNELVESFSRFILSKSAKFVCTYCGLVFSRKLSELKEVEEIRCGSCGSPMVSIYDDSYKEAIDKKLIGKKLSKSEKDAFNEAIRIAGLISSYGQRAAVALSVYGIGPTSAARALMMRKAQERSFFIDLIEAQKNFIRTKKYWSV